MSAEVIQVSPPTRGQMALAWASLAVLAVLAGVWLYSELRRTSAASEHSRALREHAAAQRQVGDAIREASERGQVGAELVAGAMRDAHGGS